MRFPITYHTVYEVDGETIIPHAVREGEEFPDEWFLDCYEAQFRAMRNKCEATLNESSPLRKLAVEFDEKANGGNS